MKRTICARQQEAGEQERDGKRRKPLGEADEAILQLEVHDFECVICSDLLVDPVVGHCGHDFCKECLQGWIDRNRQSPSCPVCRESLGALQTQHGVCRRLKELIDKLFPAQTKERRREVQQETAGRRQRQEQERQLLQQERLNAEQRELQDMEYLRRIVHQRYQWRRSPPQRRDTAAATAAGAQEGPQQRPIPRNSLPPTDSARWQHSNTVQQLLLEVQSRSNQHPSGAQLGNGLLESQPGLQGQQHAGVQQQQQQQQTARQIAARRYRAEHTAGRGTSEAAQGQRAAAQLAAEAIPAAAAAATHTFTPVRGSRSHAYQQPLGLGNASLLPSRPEPVQAGLARAGAAGRVASGAPAYLRRRPVAGTAAAAGAAAGQRRGRRVTWDDERWDEAQGAAVQTAETAVAGRGATAEEGRRGLCSGAVQQAVPQGRRATAQAGPSRWRRPGGAAAAATPRSTTAANSSEDEVEGPAMRRAVVGNSLGGAGRHQAQAAAGDAITAPHTRPIPAANFAAAMRGAAAMAAAVKLARAVRAGSEQNRPRRRSSPADQAVATAAAATAGTGPGVDAVGHEAEGNAHRASRRPDRETDSMRALVSQPRVNPQDAAAARAVIEDGGYISSEDDR